MAWSAGVRAEGLGLRVVVYPESFKPKPYLLLSVLASTLSLPLAASEKP